MAGEEGRGRVKSPPGRSFSFVQESTVTASWEAYESAVCIGFVALHSVVLFELNG